MNRDLSPSLILLFFHASRARSAEERHEEAERRADEASRLRKLLD